MELGLATAVTPHFLGSDGGSIPYFGAAPPNGAAAQCEPLRDGSKWLSYILSRGEH